MFFHFLNFLHSFSIHPLFCLLFSVLLTPPRCFFVHILCCYKCSYIFYCEPVQLCNILLGIVPNKTTAMQIKFLSYLALVSRIFPLEFFFMLKPCLACFAVRAVCIIDISWFMFANFDSFLCITLHISIKLCIFKFLITSRLQIPAMMVDLLILSFCTFKVVYHLL